jgi:uncharacterized membrane protein YfcA
VKLKSGVDVASQEIDFNKKPNLFKFVAASIGGGLAGAVGLGGGVVFNPILLGMGVPPQVVTSTGMYMIMFSAFSNSVTFFLFGHLPLDFALWIGFWSSLGIIFCLFVVNKLIKKYRRPSIIVFMLGAVIGASVIVVPLVNFTYLGQQAKEGVDIWEFGSLCSNPAEA